jgi:uncharacterized membrane protein
MRTTGTLARVLLAAVGDTPYNIMLLLHILTAVVAFAPAFVHSVLARQLAAEPAAQSRMMQAMARNSRMIYAPALLVNGLLGFGLAGMSDEVYKMSQGWLIAAIVVWIVLNGIVHAVLVPAERAVGNGDTSATGRLDVAGAVVVVLFLVMLWLMIFKPGL